MDEELGLTATAARPVVGGWNLANADRFKLLEAQGVDPQSAWKMTGTWRGKDGRLRQRIAGASALQGYGQASPISEMIGGFTGAPRRFSVMDPEAQRMQTARDIGEQASVAGQMFGAMTPFAASAAAAKTGQMMGVSPLTVYHGSPHRFSKFESSKIGTGEGAQVYGRGLYFAENPAVAKQYQQKLSGINASNSNEFTKFLDLFYKSYPDFRPVIGGIEYPTSQEFIDGIRVGLIKKSDIPEDLYNLGTKFINKGAFYTVDLPDEQIAKMLNWDVAINKQQDNVKTVLLPLAKKYGVSPTADAGSLLQWMKTGPSRMSPASISETLRDAGVPGIKYLDQGSRGTGKGTSNFVVFPGEEEALTILRQE